MGADARIICGDVRAALPTLADASVQCCVTSPPYWGLRDYGCDGQLGLERTPEEYVANMVAVFRDVWRVLRDDGVLWLNLGDSYMGGGRGGGAEDCKQRTNVGSLDAAPNMRAPGFKPKDLVGIPWMVAFALRADGWWLRSDVIWAKPNPMPESVTDRPTKAHEYLFLLTKSERYFYDADAIREPATVGDHPRNVVEDVPSAMPGAPSHKGMRRSGNKNRVLGAERGRPGTHLASGVPWEGDTRNKRSVWTITTQPFAGAHFAVMPEDLAEPCVLSGSREGDTVLDPFAGSGTVGVVALKRGRGFLGIELNPKYAQLAQQRITSDAPLFNRAEVA